MMETKKAFRKLPNIEQAITALSNLKGVGTTMASALLAAATPEAAPFMADEVLKAIPDIEGIDYTTREYLKFVTHVESTRNRLNQECGSEEWTAHSWVAQSKFLLLTFIFFFPFSRVELTVWTHSVANDIKPELLKDMPDLDVLEHKVIGTNGTNTHPAADSITTDTNTEPSDESNPAEPTDNNHKTVEQKEIAKKTANGKILNFKKMFQLNFEFL